MTDFKALIAKVAGGKSLTREEAEAAFDVMMSGEATPSQMGGFLMALRVRGETVDEITGAVATMRAKMLRVEAPADAIDVVGTGGDGAGTYNISTSAAFVVAGAGVPVAKHGNRALSSKSGAADVLARARRQDRPRAGDRVARCIREAGIGFMFAPAHHPAMKHVGPTRVELGTRTIFNLLGPLSNPAGVKRQLVGVFAPEWVEPLAAVLRDLGAERAWVVHGAGGVDEISVVGPTKVAALKDGEVTTFKISPEDVNMAFAPLDAIKGGDAKQNAEALRARARRRQAPIATRSSSTPAPRWSSPARPPTSPRARALAAASIDEGQAGERLDRLVAVSNG